MAEKFLKPAEELMDGEGTPMDVTGLREYTVRYLLIALTPDVNEIDCCLAEGVPRLYAPHTTVSRYKFGDPLSLMIKSSAKRRDENDWQVWIVTCLFSTRNPNNTEIPTDQSNNPDPRSSTGSQNNPENELPEYGWRGEDENLAIPVDLDGRFFGNSATEPLKPAPIIPVTYPIFVIQRNDLVMNRDIISDYNKALNTDVFMGAPPGYAMMLLIESDIKYKGPYQYWRSTYRIKFHWSLQKGNNQNVVNFWKNLKIRIGDAFDSPFQPLVPDMGMSELKDVNGVKRPVPIMPTPGVPVMLDGAGLRATVDPDKGRIIPTMVPFKIYQKRPFADLFKNFNPPQ